MPRRKSRIYTRNQGGEHRFYGDFRDFADVGGAREALIPKGAKRATTDEILAQAIAADRLHELQRRRRRRQRGDPLEDATLIAYAERHLRLKKNGGGVTDQWLSAVQHHLETAVRFFCNDGDPLPVDRDGNVILTGVQDIDLSSITTREVSEYVEWLSELPNGRGGTLSPSSQRKYLNSMSNLFRRAVSENVLEVPVNPVAGLLEKPQDSAGRSEANWLEVHEAAAFLDAARNVPPRPGRQGLDCAYEVVGTFLLTGGRKAEVLGLTLGDVSLEQATVRFRPNQWRSVKTRGSDRSVPLWPQLKEILSPHIESHDGSSDSLLFPSPRTGRMITDLRCTLDRISEHLGWSEGSVRTYAFRHTYASARLQTLDRGSPISTFTVARELGHGGDSLVKHVYGHLGQVRHRSEVVEYRL